MVVAALAPACGGSDSSNAQSGSGASGSGASGSGGASSGGSSSGGSSSGGSGGNVPSTCVAPTAEPIVHPSGSITADETWGPDAVHVVQGTIQIRDGATLTLDPCVEVRMGPGSYFQLPATGNAIVANGEADKRVRIVADDPAAGWGNIRVLPTSSLSFSYTTIEDGGREPGNDAQRAVLDVYGDQNQPLQSMLHVDHVDIVGAGKVGVAVTENAGFTADSTALTITGAGLFPMRLWPTALTSIPAGDYTGNTRDELVVVGRPLTVDATMHDRGVRYLVGDELSTTALTVAAGATGLATLTIEPGVEMAFQDGGILEIEPYTSDLPSSGALIAVGTADNPIVFTSAGSATAGAWVGISFASVPDPSNRIEHARVEFAGGLDGTQGFNCSEVGEGRDQAGILILGPPAGPFVQSTTISDSAGHGIDRGWKGAGVDFLTSNTFTNIAWCHQSAPHNPNNSCPADTECVMD